LIKGVLGSIGVVSSFPGNLPATVGNAVTTVTLAVWLYPK
jgi:hypothetical protein